MNHNVEDPKLVKNAPETVSLLIQFYDW